SVAIVTKKRAADSATNWAQGGVAAVHDGDDSFESHVQDTLVAGDGLCRLDVVQRVVSRGPAMIDALLKLGADFDVSSQPSRPGVATFDLGREGGPSHRRILHHRDATGREIERVLLSRARAHPNIALFEDHCGVDLLTASKLGWSGPNRAIGAYVLDAD